MVSLSGTIYGKNYLNVTLSGNSSTVGYDVRKKFTLPGTMSGKFYLPGRMSKKKVNLPGKMSRQS
jgi:hypothetical protein